GPRCRGARARALRRASLPQRAGAIFGARSGHDMTAVRRAPAKAAPSVAPQPGRELVLVVDDDEQMLKLVKRVLERAGFECVAVGDGREAHDAAIDWRPDIILLDLMLGATTGEEILTEL